MTGAIPVWQLTSLQTAMQYESFLELSGTAIWHPLFVIQLL